MYSCNLSESFITLEGSLTKRDSRVSFSVEMTTCWSRVVKSDPLHQFLSCLGDAIWM